MTPGIQVPDTLKAADLAGRVRAAITGPNASGSEAIVWQDHGDEVVVHTSTLQVRLVPPALFAAVDMESDQTGRGSLIVRLVFGNQEDAAGLFATTDEVVRGQPALAARWGSIFRDLVWSALLGLSRDHAVERGQAPLSINIGQGALQFAASASIPLPDRVKQVVATPTQKPPLKPPILPGTGRSQ